LITLSATSVNCKYSLLMQWESQMNTISRTESTIVKQYDEATGIARIIFNRPKVLNAVNVEMAGELLKVVREIAKIQNLRCVVLLGAGGNFMAGGDVAAFGDKDTAANTFNTLIDALNPAVLAFRQLEVPVLAGVQGVAAGAGLSFALLADLILASEKSKFLLAYDRIAAVPDCGGSWFLPRKIGYTRSMELMLLSTNLTAKEAREWGFVSKVVPEELFNAELESLSKKLATGPSDSYAKFRHLLDASSGGRSLAAHLEAERNTFLDTMRTNDFVEGVTAFLGKRSAKFSGR
jgi:2-(1,2-epoxy-1,2-dihydrophenyl)acetyl-CoA isomerase